MFSIMVVYVSIIFVGCKASIIEQKTDIIVFKFVIVCQIILCLVM